MSNVVPSLEQFFESLLTTLHEAIEGLNCEYESNRAESLASRLGDFEGTLGLIASRWHKGVVVIGCWRTLNTSQVLCVFCKLTTDPDRYFLVRAMVMHSFTTTVQWNAQAKHVDHDMPLTRTLYSVCGMSHSSGSTARILRISPKTLFRRRQEFGMPVGQDAFTRIEEHDLDQHVRDILQRTPEAGLHLVEGGLRGRGLKIQFHE